MSRPSQVVDDHRGTPWAALTLGLNTARPVLAVGDASLRAIVGLASRLRETRQIRVPRMSEAWLVVQAADEGKHRDGL
jgi:hypothetical protein